jgi:hypothetical protein
VAAFARRLALELAVTSSVLALLGVAWGEAKHRPLGHAIEMFLALGAAGLVLLAFGALAGGGVGVWTWWPPYYVTSDPEASSSASPQIPARNVQLGHGGVFASLGVTIGVIALVVAQLR